MARTCSAADPTATTPCADLAGVESMGLFQVVADPRTSIVQSLHSILVAELADHDSWECLIDIAVMMNQDELVARFREAFSREAGHLEIIRNLFLQMTREDASSNRTSAA